MNSRETAAAMVRFLGAVTHQWDVVADATNQEELQAWMTAGRLKGINLVFFANTTGDLNLTTEQKKAFYDWIKDGGGFAGVHSAADTYHGDADYLDLLRGEFESHGAQVKVVVRNQDPLHPATRNVPETFEIYDEIYLFKNWSRDKVHVLLSMTTHPNKPEVAGDFPVAWTNRVGKGRMFYTSLGHREDVYLNKVYLDHLAGGLQWALGLENGDDAPGNPQR